MSFLGRLFGRAAPAPAPPVPPTTAVTVPDDVAAALTADGRPLAEAVETALREQLAARGRDAEREPGRIPFWLERDEGERQIEDELRDRLERRRAAEAEGDVVAAGDESPPGRGAPARRRRARTPAPPADAPGQAAAAAGDADL